MFFQSLSLVSKNKRALTRWMLTVPILFLLKTAVLLIISFRAIGHINPIFILRTNPEYRQMLILTRNNYAHFLRDVVYRSFVRDFPNAIKIERWMYEREPEYFRTIERADDRVKFEFVEQPNKRLFAWDEILRVCGKFFEEDASCKEIDFRFGDAFGTIGGNSSTIGRRRRMVFLSRGKNRRRAIANERFAYESLKKEHEDLEYLEISSEILRKKNPMVKQAEMFSDVDVLISLHGAGLTNMLYMPEDALVIEIMPNGYSKDTYMNFAKRLKLRYERLSAGEAEEEEGTKSSNIVSFSTKMKYAFDGKENRNRKFKRDVIIKLNERDITSLKNMMTNNK